MPKNKAARQPVTTVRYIGDKYEVVAGTLRGIVSGTVIPTDEPVFLLRARDSIALSVLIRYLANCKVAGCHADQLASVQHAIDEFSVYQDTHAAEMKVPDVVVKATMSHGKDKRYV